MGPGPGAGMPQARDGARTAHLRVGPGWSWLGALVLAALAKGMGEKGGFERTSREHPLSLPCSPKMKELWLFPCSPQCGQEAFGLHADVMRSIHR